MEIWWANNQGKTMMYGNPKTSKTAPKAPPKKGVPVTIMVAVGKPKMAMKNTASKMMKSGRGK
jgi:hypothetical protein